MEPDEEGEWVWVRPPTEADSEFWGNGDTEDEEPSRPLKLVFTEPAKHWTDAVPIGNGRLGAMVWGNVPNETLQLNHDTLWTGVPGDYTNPDAPGVLSKVRKLVDDGLYAEATTAAFGLSDHSPEVYQPLGNINLEFDDSHLNYTSYVRELDLSTATVKVKYNLGDVEFTREHFSSNPHQVVVTKISSTKKASISFIVYSDSKLHHHSVANSSNRIIMEGNCPGKRRPPKVELSKNSDGIQFAAVLDVQIAGNNAVVQVVEDRKLKIEGADWAVLLLAASSSFEGPFINPMDSKRDPISESLNTVNSIQNLSYSQLLAYHLDDYSQLLAKQLSSLANRSIIKKKIEGFGVYSAASRDRVMNHWLSRKRKQRLRNIQRQRPEPSPCIETKDSNNQNRQIHDSSHPSHGINTFRRASNHYHRHDSLFRTPHCSVPKTINASSRR